MLFLILCQVIQNALRISFSSILKPIIKFDFRSILLNLLIMLQTCIK